MRDIIWTIIIIWVVWKIIDVFRGISHAKNAQSNVNQNRSNNNTTSAHTEPETPKKGHLKPGAGEYVDYEETK